MSKGTTYNCLKFNRLRFKSTADSPKRCVVLFYGMAGRLALPCGRAGARPYRDGSPCWRARPNRTDCPRQRSGGRAKTPDINLWQKRQARGTSPATWRLHQHVIHARIPKAPRLPIQKLLQRSHTQHDCVSSDMRPGMWHQTFCRPLGCIQWTRACDSAQVFSARRERNETPLRAVRPTGVIATGGSAEFGFNEVFAFVAELEGEEVVSLVKGLEKEFVPFPHLLRE